jgi:hypothetical protein
LEALGRFHARYDRLSPRLPESRGTVRTWLDSPVWREIMAEAATTLAEIPALETDARETGGRGIVEV